jgi:hypothetical protein
MILRDIVFLLQNYIDEIVGVNGWSEYIRLRLFPRITSYTKRMDYYLELESNTRKVKRRLTQETQKVKYPCFTIS